MSAKKKLLVLSGSGISAESGIATFRGNGGLWEGHDIMEVASPQGWQKDRAVVLDFYNQRRKAALIAQPNRAHIIAAELEEFFDVTIVTQNVDNLHERAGSSNVLHLHGELFKSRSTADESLIYDIEGWELSEGDLCEKGSQLRPHIVWFGEMVPMMDLAMDITAHTEILIIIGTSLQVYPAASLIDYAQPHIPKFLVDPHLPQISEYQNLQMIEEAGTIGMQKVKEILLKESY